MEEVVRIRDEFIRLGQAMKLLHRGITGSAAKEMIQSGLVSVNGEVEVRRGRKLVPGDKVSFRDTEFRIEGL